MIQQIERIRPHFKRNELLLHDRTAELSFLPSELVPHTITANLKANWICEIIFEYQIDEIPATKESLSMGIVLEKGKYTNKVLSLTIDFNSHTDLINKIAVSSQCLKIKKNMLTKDSHKRNYDLSVSILDEILSRVQNDTQLKNLVGG